MSNHTHPVATVSHFLHRHFLACLVGSYVLAALWPAPGLWLKDVVLGEVSLFGERLKLTLPMLMLALLLLNAGLGARLSRPGELVRTFPLLSTGLGANLLIPLVFILGVSQALRLWPDPDEAQALLLGLALIASMPIAGSSTAWSQNNNGHMPLSLGLVLLSTLLSPLTTPLALHAVGLMANGDHADNLHRLAAQGTGGFLVVCVVLPSLLGVLGRGLVGGARIDALKPQFRLVNCVTLLLLNYANGAAALPQVAAEPDWDFLAATLGIALVLCVLAFASGWALGRLLKTDLAHRMSLMFGLGMNNNGSGLVLATVAFAGNPRVMLPVIFYNLVQHLVAGFVASLLNRTDRSLTNGGDKEGSELRVFQAQYHAEDRSPSCDRSL
jgi:bile acid:Na+ symporter, BASS family